MNIELHVLLTYMIVSGMLGYSLAYLPAQILIATYEKVQSLRSKDL